MSLRSLADVGHDHFSDSEFAIAIGKLIDKITSKIIFEPEIKEK